LKYDGQQYARRQQNEQIQYTKQKTLYAVYSITETTDA